MCDLLFTLFSHSPFLANPGPVLVIFPFTLLCLVPSYAPLFASLSRVLVFSSSRRLEPPPSLAGIPFPLPSFLPDSFAISFAFCFFARIF